MGGALTSPSLWHCASGTRAALLNLCPTQASESGVGKLRDVKCLDRPTAICK